MNVNVSDQVSSERRYLLYSIIGCALVAVAGTTAALLTESEAILLDGLFNLVYLFVGLFTLKVAALLQAGDDEHFPMGYAYFEPLVNGIKGMLILGISALALFSSIDALFEGGRPISAEGAMIYGVFATAVGATLAVIMRRGAKLTGSPLIRVDAENWFINGAISSAVLLAFIGTWFISGTEYAHLAPYADPVVVIVIVVLTIAVPVRMAWTALMEMLNRAPSKDVVDAVTTAIHDELSELPLEELFVRVIQPGRLRMVLVHAVLPREWPVQDLSQLDAIRNRVYARLTKMHSPLELDLIFTTDRSLGAPAQDSR